MTTLCRLEQWTGREWQVMHAGVALLHPERYVERLEDRNVVARVTELDDRLQPTGVVYGPTVDPVAVEPPEPVECPFCMGTICADGSTGSCLI